MHKIVNIIFSITAIVSCIICIMCSESASGAYKLLFLQPLIWIICYIFVLNPLVLKKRFLITVYSNNVLTWVAYVLTPLFTMLSGDYNDVNQNTEKALFLLVYGLIISSFFLYFAVTSFPSKSRTQKSFVDREVIKNDIYSGDRSYMLGGNRVLYVTFILLAIIVYFLYGRNYDLVRFFIVSSEGDAFKDTTSTMLVLIRTILTGAIAIMFVLVTDSCAKKFEKTKKIRYVNFAILAGVINVGIIVGQRRSAQIYTAMIVVLILTSVFENQKKRIVSLVAISASIVLIGLSLYKHFNVAGVGSYNEAIQNNVIDINFISQNLNAYFHGVKETELVFAFYESVKLDFANLLYDFARSTFGLSFLLKGQSVTSELYNMYFYSGMQTSGHTLHSFMYGYIFFGTILSPVFTAINMGISLTLENWFEKTKYYDIRYIVGIALVRFCTALYANTSSLWSFTSNHFATIGLVCLVAVFIGNANNITKRKELQK